MWKSLIQELNSHCNSKNMMLIQSYSKWKKNTWKNANNLIEIFDILFTSTHYKIQFLTFLLLKWKFNKKGKKFVKMATFLIMKCWFFLIAFSSKNQSIRNKEIYFGKIITIFLSFSKIFLIIQFAKQKRYYCRWTTPYSF